MSARMTQIEELTPHPKNYRTHPEDQIAHIRASIEEHGFYRNVVVARDGTILAGHGVVETAKAMGLEEVPAVWLDIDPDSAAALKVLTGDNAIAGLAMVDDRELTELLKEVHEADTLLGTGFTDAQLASLVMVTRPATEIETFNEAAEWVGMPEFEGMPVPINLSIQFRSEEDRDRFVQEMGLGDFHSRKGRRTWSMWWPDKEIDDVQSVEFLEMGEEDLLT